MEDPLSEMLFLAVKMLRSTGKYGDTLQTLERELVSRNESVGIISTKMSLIFFQTLLSCLFLRFCVSQNETQALGQVHNWNGSSRPANMEDMNRKHKNLRGDEIMAHLTHSVTILKKKDATVGFPSTYLQPVSGVYRNNDVHQREAFQSLAESLVEAIVQLRKIRRDVQSLTQKKDELELAIIDDNDSNSAAEGTTEEMGVDDQMLMTSSSSSSSSSIDAIIDLTDTLPLNPVLRGIGQRKELQLVCGAIEDSKNRAITYVADIDRLTTGLAELGCLSSSSHRGVVDSGLCLITARNTGLLSATTAGR